MSKWKIPLHKVHKRKKWWLKQKCSWCSWGVLSKGWFGHHLYSHLHIALISFRIMVPSDGHMHRVRARVGRRRPIEAKKRRCYNILFEKVTPYKKKEKIHSIQLKLALNYLEETDIPWFERRSRQRVFFSNTGILIDVGKTLGQTSVLSPPIWIASWF